MIRKAIEIVEKNIHRDFVKSALDGCGMKFVFKKNDEDKGGLDTNYIYVNHGKYKLVVSISNPDKKEGIFTFSTSIDFIPEDKKNPKIYFNAPNIDSALSWIKNETGLDIDKKNLKL